MEGTHRQLGTGLADGLGGDDTDRLTDGDGLTVRKVRAVALLAPAVLGAAGEDGADLDALDAGIADDIGFLFAHEDVLGDQHVAVLITEVTDKVAADQTLVHLFDDLLARLDIKDLQTFVGMAVVVADDNLLRDVDQTTGQVTGVGGTQRGIGKTFTGAAGGDEVLQNVQTFTIIRSDRDFDGLTGGVGDQSAHTRELTDLAHGTTRAGVGHHVNRIISVQIILELVGNVVGRLFPDRQNLFVSFLIGTQTHVELFADRVDVLFGLGDDLLLLGRDIRVTDRDGDRPAGGVLVALCLHVVQHDSGDLGAVHADAGVDDLAQLLFADEEVDLKLEDILLDRSVDKAEILRDRTVEDDLADRGFDDAALELAVDLHLASDLDLAVQGHDVGLVRHQRLVDVLEDLALAGLAVFVKGQVVGAENHILRRNDDRLTVGGLEQVAGSQHEEAGFRLRLCGQRYVHRHLVAVEVGVVRGTNQRMELQRSALDEDGLKRLDAQSVQGRRTVQEDGMSLDDDLERVPYLGLRSFNSLTRRLDILRDLGLDQTLHDEGLEQLQRHLLGQTALVHLQLRADNDNGTAGVVDTLAQQVLTEATLLTLEHIGQGL